MKPIVLFFFLIIIVWFPMISFAQTTNLSYEYDGSGNRVLRHVIVLKSTKVTKDSLLMTSTKEKERSALNEKLDNREIKIYPNPTKGMITVDIPLTDNDISRVSLFDIQGKMIMDYRSAGTTTDVDLSGQPAGVYIMRIILNNKSTTWKIIKQD
jgi:hypothetical protein